MRVEFINNCSRHISLTVEEKNIIISPSHSICVEGLSSTKFSFAIKCKEKSRCHKGNYIISIESSYDCYNSKERPTLVITREQTRIDLNVYFERLLVSSDTLESNLTSYTVPDEIAIKRLFNTNKLLRFLLIDPLEYSTGFVVILIVVGVVLSYIYGWKCAVLYFPISYLLLLTINWFSEKFCNVVFKKVFKLDTDKTQFYSFFENDYIARYYADLGREPFMGEIEVDRLS